MLLNREVVRRLVRALPVLLLAVLLLAEAVLGPALRSAVETSCELYSKHPVPPPQ